MQVSNLQLCVTGYVLSKEALKRFVEQALPDTSKCKTEGPEDVEIGKCTRLDSHSMILVAFNLQSALIYSSMPN